MLHKKQVGYDVTYINLENTESSAIVYAYAWG